MEKEGLSGGRLLSTEIFSKRFFCFCNQIQAVFRWKASSKCPRQLIAFKLAHRAGFLWSILSVFFFFSNLNFICSSFLRNKPRLMPAREIASWRSSLLFSSSPALQKGGHRQCSKAHALKWERPGSESHLCHFQVERPCASYLTSGCLGFIIYKMQVIWLCAHTGFVRLKWQKQNNKNKNNPQCPVSLQCLVHVMCCPNIRSRKFWGYTLPFFPTQF